MDWKNNWNLVKPVELKPVSLLGKSLMVYMRSGGAFYFKAMEAGGKWVNGYDDEGLNLRLYMDDIEFVHEISTL